MTTSATTHRSTAHNLRTFLLIWLGQVFSLTGSGLTGFALGLWVYQQTGSVTQFAYISVATLLPQMLLTPFAGALIDRWDRRLVMAVCNLVAGVTTCAFAWLNFSELLLVWHIYLGMSLISCSNAFLLPAYYASTTLLVPQDQRGRVNGMVQLGQAAAQIVAPVLAGLLLVTIDISGILLLDFGSYLFALTTLLLVRIPRPEANAAQSGQSSLLGEVAYGWRYISERPGLLGLMLFITVSNFVLGIVSVLVTPLVMAIASPSVLGTVLSVGGCGMLIGSIVMSVWGGPNRRIAGVLGFMLLGGLFILIGGSAPSPIVIGAAAFCFFFCLPIVNSCNIAIMQSKVAVDVQGRVFAFSGMLANLAMPVAFVVAGPLVDRVFEPLLAVRGPLASTVGTVIGVGPGRGIGLLFMLLGAAIALIVGGSYLYRPLREIERELPDAEDASSGDKIAVVKAGPDGLVIVGSEG
ncbi:MAG TPA: MFS transporter [Herpetosiphonaceae bacterium]